MELEKELVKLHNLLENGRWLKFGREITELSSNDEFVTAVQAEVINPSVERKPGFDIGSLLAIIMAVLDIIKFFKNKQ